MTWTIHFKFSNTCATFKVHMAAAVIFVYIVNCIFCILEYSGTIHVNSISEFSLKRQNWKTNEHDWRCLHATDLVNVDILAIL